MFLAGLSKEKQEAFLNLAHTMVYADGRLDENKKKIFESYKSELVDVDFSKAHDFVCNFLCVYNFRKSIIRESISGFFRKFWKQYVYAFSNNDVRRMVGSNCLPRVMTCLLKVLNSFPMPSKS